MNYSLPSGGYYVIDQDRYMGTGENRNDMASDRPFLPKTAPKKTCKLSH